MTVSRKLCIVVLLIIVAGVGYYGFRRVARRQAQARLSAVPQNNFPRAFWTNAGFGSHRATLQTCGWAVLNNDRAQFTESVFILDDLRPALEQKLGLKPGADRFGLEAALLARLAALNKENAFTGFAILSEGKAGGIVLVELETQRTSGPGRKQALKFRDFGTNWKIMVDEDSLKDWPRALPSVLGQAPPR